MACVPEQNSGGETRREKEKSPVKAQRLTIDHRPDDPREVERIEHAGGFCVKGRVLGMVRRFFSVEPCRTLAITNCIFALNSSSWQSVARWVIRSSNLLSLANPMFASNE